MVLLEVCVDDRASLEAALRGGADRLEVCSRLDLGGLTPESGFLREALELARPRGVPVHAMVRPRADASFVAEATELAELHSDLARVREQPIDGVVLGVLDEHGKIARERLAELVARARPCAVTFHRAFDRVRDPSRELEVLIELGIERVLTSGGAPSALEGAATLRALVDQARGRIVILPGGGVRAHNSKELLARTGAVELHSSVPFRPA